MSFREGDRRRRRRRLAAWIGAVMTAVLAGAMGLVGTNSAVADPTPPTLTGRQLPVTGRIVEHTSGGSYDTQIYVRTTWELPDGHNPVEGDWFTIQLPDGQSAQPNVPFWLTSSGGYIAHATWSGNVATVVFTDYVEGKDDVHGTADFYTMHQGTHADGPITLTYFVGASRFDQTFDWINYGPPPENHPHSFFYKSGGFMNWSDQGLHQPQDAMVWTLKAPAGVSGPGTFTDTPAPGHVINPDRVTVIRGDMDNPETVLVRDSQYTMTYDTATGVLTVDVGAITVGPRQWLEVKLFTSITDQTLLDFHNTGTFEHHTWTERAGRQVASGTGDGSALTHGKIALTKSGVTGASMAGAQFEIMQGGSSSGMLTTAADGTAESGWLLPGAYELVERVAPPGHLLDPTPVPVTVAIGATPVAVARTNEPGGWIEVAKTGTHTGGPLGGVVFEVRDSAGTLVDTLTTDAVTGLATTVMLPVGEYTVTETGPLPGFLAVAPVTADVTFNATTTVDVENVAGGWIEVVKTASHTGDPVGDVVFDVTDSGGVVVATLTTDATTGRARTGMLPVGDYTVTEVSSPDGFLGVAPRDVDVRFNWVAEVYVVNPAGGWIEVAKTASHTGDPVGDVVFEVTDPAGGVVATLATDPVTGLARTAMLPVGTYTVTETSSPSGYFGVAPVTADVTFNTVTPVPVANDPGGWIEVAKSGADTGGPLGGAVFEVTDANGAVVATLTTDDVTGTARTVLLPLGDHTVTETTAPEGYALAAPVPATVAFNAVTHLDVVDDVVVISQVLADDNPVLVDDERAPDAPTEVSQVLAAGALASTGSNLLVPAAVAGMLLVMTGAVLLTVRRRATPTAGRHSQG